MYKKFIDEINISSLIGNTYLEIIAKNTLMSLNPSLLKIQTVDTPYFINLIGEKCKENAFLKRTSCYYTYSIFFTTHFYQLNIFLPLFYLLCNVSYSFLIVNLDEYPIQLC